MENIRLFDYKNSIEFTENNSFLNDSIIGIIKNHTELFFNLKLIETEYVIGKDDKIDILALDGIHSPVVVLFQKSVNENIITKGIFCLDWIMQHKTVFSKLVLKVFPCVFTDKINWTNARLLCISNDFSKYDKYTVFQMNRNIELIRLRKYPNKLLLFEVVNDLKISDGIDLSDTHSQQINFVVENIEQKQDRFRKQDMPISTVSKIGYCSIENNKHFIVFPGKKREEIKDIPESIYIGDGQFILVDNYYKFKWAYPYIVDNKDTGHSAGSYGVAILNDSCIYIDKGNRVLEKINGIPGGIQLIHKQIILVDLLNSLLRFYKPFKHNADTIYKSVKAKGHQMAFVLKRLSDGALLRDIETGKEFFRNIKAGSKDFTDHQVICLADEEVISVFNSYKFYTLSSFYNKIDFGTVELKRDAVFFRKMSSGELVRLKDAPSNLTQGQTIYVDENNNFTGIMEESVYLFEQLRKRNHSNVPLQNKINRSDAIEVKKDILILGNKTYENSYKLTLLKSGYRTEVIEGYEPWAKISTYIKEVDVVVIIVSHISHDNMWRIKKEVIDIPVIYSEHDGANRILEEIVRIEKQSGAM